MEVGEGVVELAFNGGEDLIDLVSDGIGLLGSQVFSLLGSQLHELLHGVLLEEVAVHGESLSNVGGGDFSEAAGLVGEVSTDVMLQELNDFNGIRVVLEGLDEETIGKTSLILEFVGLSLDLSESSFSPLEPLVGLSDLVIDAVSVSLSSEPVVLVDVDDFGELADDFSTIFLIGSVLVISSDLDLEVLALEVSEQVIDGLHGIISPGSGLYQSSEL